MSADGLAEAVRLVAARGARAQLCVLRHGRVVLDRTFGCAPDALFWIFSVSKPYVALLVHQLAERGRLDLDDPVAAHWPEFAGGGKAEVTIRHVLTHRAGLPTAGSLLGDAVAMTDWQLFVRRIERAQPLWPPGSVAAYSPLTFGFVLGELVNRVAGRPVAQQLRTGVLDPLGLADTHLGLPDRLWSRHVPVRLGGRAGAVAQIALNQRAARRAVVPAAGVSTTARDVALLYRHLLAATRGEAREVLSDRAMADALTPAVADDERDHLSGLPIRWGAGFQLGGPRSGPFPGPMGARSSRRTFGHNGSNTCIAWADPDRDLVYAYLTNLRTTPPADRRHQVKVADTVLAACG